MNVLIPHGVVDWVLSLNLLSVVGVLVGVGIVLFALAGMMRRPAGGEGRRVSRDGKRIAGELAARWQLLLLGATGFVLSLASGYTTWMGMTNFTGEKVLSLMVTFGIQGVMLIVAWLIGESFAAGMSTKAPDGRRAGVLDQVIGIVLAVALVSAVFYWILSRSGAVGWTGGGQLKPVEWSRFADISAYFALALIVVGVLAFNLSRGGDLAVPYVRSTRVIIKNAVLWVMFLACMATSVFFSYDSLFTAIFPKEERVRSAQLRAQNQVAGIVSDIGSTIETRRLQEVDRLFESKGWLDYDKHLTSLAQASQGAQPAIEAYFNAQLEDKNRAIKQQQERIATAQSGSAGLQTKKISITEELARLKAERPGLAGELAEKKTELDSRAKAIDAKRVEAMAEERGAEGTLKQGKGPVYRQRMDEMARMNDAFKIQEDRVRDAQKRITSVDTRIAQIERELASVDGELAKYKGEAETAEQRIKLTQESSATDGRPRIDPARVLPAFENARVNFRQEPTVEKLTALHGQCSNLLSAMLSTPATKDRVRGLECDPKQASEAAGVMFGLNAGQKAFDANCAGGDKLNANTTTDALYAFARKCLADSGLPGRETETLRTKINFADLQRDDKAHPFVATLNAFNDGNYLAYLALAIAIAMDSLVFMSGLFGANAIRSPLSDVPSHKSRSGKQLESIMENALLPDTFDNARAVLNAMRPMTPHDGFTARVLLDPADSHAADIRRVLNAAATIGAVRHSTANGNEYEVRSELFEFLSVVAKKAFHADESHARMADLRKVVTVALQPHVGDHADIVLHHCHPMTEDRGFSSVLYLSQMSADDAFVSQKALNAGATLGYVQQRDAADRSFFIHKQLYKTLLLISAAHPKTGDRSYVPALAGPAPRRQLAQGGDITPKAAAIGAAAAAPRIAPPIVPAAGQAARAAPQAQPQQQAYEPARQAAAADDENELRNEFWNRLLGALGIDPETANPRLHVAGLADAAINAWNALFEHARQNRTLSDLLRRHQVTQEQLLSAEYEALSHEVRLSRRQIDLLDEVDHTVRSYLPALMMFPENGLIKFLIEQLERAAQPDDGMMPGEQSLKDRLKGLQQDIAGLDLEAVGAWEQISQWFADGLSPQSPQIVRLHPNRRQRN